MKPTLWCQTLLYLISIQQFNLQISKHTPNQENNFSDHISTNFLYLWHPSMRYQRLNRRKCCPLFSIHLLQHLFTEKANLCYKYLHLLTTTCPDSQPIEVPGWELGKMLVSDFRHPVRVGHGQLWSPAHYLLKLATITYAYTEINTSDQRYVWRDQRCPSRVAWEKVRKRLPRNDQVFCLTYAFVITWVC